MPYVQLRNLPISISTYTIENFVEYTLAPSGEISFIENCTYIFLPANQLVAMRTNLCYYSYMSILIL